MSQIYNLTSDVSVTSFQMGSTPNLEIILPCYSEKCVQSFCFSILLRCDVIYAYVRGATICPLQRPAGAVARMPSGRRVKNIKNIIKETFSCYAL